MNVREVRELVRAGRAIKALNYHAGRRGLGFVHVITALENCYHVERDTRADGRGNQLHADGWFALASLPSRLRLRVDFDVSQDEAGKLLVIVTAYEV